MMTMTQSEAIKYLKNRVKQLKEENTALVNENEELNEAITAIFEISSGFCLVKENELKDLGLSED